VKLTEGTEPVDADNWRAAYEKERLPVWSFTKRTWIVSSEEERVDPCGLRFSLSER